MSANHLWLFDLVAADRDTRHRALARHQAALAAAREASEWENSVWGLAGTPAPTEPHLSAEIDQARADLRWQREQTISGLIDRFLSGSTPTPVARELYMPFVLLYLRWEAAYPLEWGAPESRAWSPWTTKEVILRNLSWGGVPEEVRPQVEDLVIAALERSYRCKDWMYAPLVRHLPAPEFHARVDALLDADDPLIRLRAQFIQHVARHPDHPVKLVSWQRWLSTGTLGPGSAKQSAAEGVDRADFGGGEGQ